MPPVESNKTVLLIGASRGLGFAMVEEYLRRGWHVIATCRSSSTSKLHDLAAASAGALEIEFVDITLPEEVSSLRQRLADRTLDVLFVNAGIANEDDETIGNVSTDAFISVMVTNALSPLRVVETLHDLVAPSGTIGIMSSGQGSLTNNTRGMHELYRGSKAALNMFMRSFAARHHDDPRTLLLMAPGWVQTDMGGPNARLTINESIPNLVSTIEAHAGEGGLHYLDYQNKTVPW